MDKRDKQAELVEFVDGLHRSWPRSRRRLNKGGMMNYEQANSVKELAPRVNEVLEKLG